MINPIVIDPKLTISFPLVTRDEMVALLALAKDQGAEVNQCTPSDVSMTVIAYRRLLVFSVQAVCLWDSVAGLTVQVGRDRDVRFVEERISAQLKQIRRFNDADLNVL